jgi:hypothetical protein
MAFTASLSRTTVFGDQRVQQYTVTADAASGSVVTGLGNIDQVHFTPSSLTTMGVKVRKNALGGATAAVGTVGFDGFASGDVGYLTVFGR